MARSPRSFPVSTLETRACRRPRPVATAHARPPMCIRPGRSASIDSAVDTSGRESQIGRLAQLVARFLHTEEVVGSSPASPTDAPTPLGAFFISRGAAQLPQSSEGDGGESPVSAVADASAPAVAGIERRCQ